MKTFSWSYAVAKILKMVTSRKFLVLLFAALGVSGLDLQPEWQAFAIYVAAGVYAALQAFEDVNQGG
jgi:hypothetical protein